MSKFIGLTVSLIMPLTTNRIAQNRCQKCLPSQYKCQKPLSHIIGANKNKVDKSHSISTEIINIFNIEVSIRKQR